MAYEVTEAIEKKALLALKRKAFKRGLWFKALTHIERALVDSVIMVVDQVRSPRLTRILRSIMSKLIDRSKVCFTRLVREIGRPLAKRISLIAHSWGHQTAFKWGEDIRFAQFLTMMRVNASSKFYRNEISKT